MRGTQLKAEALNQPQDLHFSFDRYAHVVLLFVYSVSVIVLEEYETTCYGTCGKSSVVGVGVGRKPRGVSRPTPSVPKFPS